MTVRDNSGRRQRRGWCPVVISVAALTVAVLTLFPAGSVAAEPVSCPPGSPDDWNTWAHDYQRTSASQIALGDPCGVSAVWTQPLGAMSQFCEPTVAGTRVYLSGDNRFCSFELASGAPGLCIQGIPYMFGSNRCNATVDDNAVFVTTGNLRSLWAWNLNLSQAFWQYPSLHWFPFAGDVRFGVTAVFEVGGTRVVFLGDESSRLYAIEGVNGNLYTGWPTNPLILTGAALHSPAYDGAGTLYIGTATPSTLAHGAIYSIDAATGAINWVYDDPNLTDEGYPGGVSYEDGFIYAASNVTSGFGRRVKLDSDGNEVWNHPQARILYGAPTIGPDHLYIGQDITGQGVLVVDKTTGAAIHNFAFDGVGQVPQHVTLTCDGYLFAGDRQGRWWLLNANTLEAEWSVQFNGIVNGTALATHPVTGDDYAVVGVRSGAGGNPGLGQVTAFKLNAGPRPRVVQHAMTETISVPFNSGAANLHTVPDVLENIGCADLIISHNVIDLVTGDPLDDSLSLYATGITNRTVGQEYPKYFNETNQPRRADDMRTLLDNELTVGDRALENALTARHASVRAVRQMAAAASLVRTSAVTYDATVPAGGKTQIAWQWDGTGLGRGTDVEQIELVTNDPDRVVLGTQPRLTIVYEGGCPPESAVLNFGVVNSERVYNTGQLAGSPFESTLVWEGLPSLLYSASLIVCGDSIPGAGVQFRTALNTSCGQYENRFVPNPDPVTGDCGLTGDTDILLGFRRAGGCPGAPQEIHGEWVRSFYSDTNLRVPPTSPIAAIGLNVIQTEVGAYDPVYGDFKLIRWEFENRRPLAKTIYAGTIMDWDAPPSRPDNIGLVADLFNGYVIWDGSGGTAGLGMLDPATPSSVTGIDVTYASPHRIHVMNAVLTVWSIFPDWFCEPQFWDYCVNYKPSRAVDALGSINDEAAGLLINHPVTVPASGTAAIHQALFGVDASSLDPAVIESNGLNVAMRAARWAGFARGDVNDDGIINLLDVCWLLSGHAIYPDTYCGDVDLSGTVDAADRDYLLQFVTGIGPALLGEWRFTF